MTDEEDLSKEALLERADQDRHVRPRFVPMRVVVAACLTVSAFVFGAFFFAPALRAFLPAALLEPLSAQSPPTDRPIGPPGSITDKTSQWASVGESWSAPEQEEAETTGLRWNGTHRWKKTVVMVSIDGLRADYIDRGLTPHLLEISRKGLAAESMKPQFPTLTFPNHWSMLTGLHAESHGIVANDFWCPELEREFVYTEPSKSWDADWWKGEPIWAVAEKQEVKTAVLMWPGPPTLADRTRPTYWHPYEHHYKWSKKLTNIFKWLDMPFDQRPQLVLGYIPEVDQVGHAAGPDDPRHRVNRELREVDQFADALYRELAARNLDQIVDVIFVSDHGMTDTADIRLVYLDLLLGDDYKRITHKEGWPSAGLRFEEGVDTDEILKKLQKLAKERTGFDVYTHDTMPARWHFSHNPRIAPIYIVPHHGWAITDEHEHKVLMHGQYQPHGNHGYDNAEHDMQAFFVAHGPFAERVKARRRRDGHDDHVTTIPPFENTELFGLVAKLLDLRNLPPTNSTADFWDAYF